MKKSVKCSYFAMYVAIEEAEVIAVSCTKKDENKICLNISGLQIST